MTALPREALRRGWCPSTLRPMETGDGWLVRLHPPHGVLTPTQLGTIAALAAEYGNGLVEISARANLQIRGVRADTHPALVAALLAAGLVDEHEGNSPQRLTLVSPLTACFTLPRHSGALRSNEPGTHTLGAATTARDDAGARACDRSGSGFQARGFAAPRNDAGGDVSDLAGLASAIETSSRAIPSLPAKTLVVVDDGGEMSLDAFACDLRLVAVAPDAVALGLPGGAWLGPVLPVQAPAIVTTILQRFAARHRSTPDSIRRLRDVPDDGLVMPGTLPAMAAPAPRAATRRAGLFALTENADAALIGLPFGRTDGATLAGLAEAASAAGVTAIRLSPWRGLAFHGLTHEDATALLAQAEALGLIVGDEDPRLSVQACAGAPACLRGEADAMADAAVLARAAGPLLAQGVSLHVSACIKSCAHPGAADLTLVGEQGLYQVVIGGTTRDPATARLDLSQILRRLLPGQDIHEALTARRGGRMM